MKIEKFKTEYGYWKLQCPFCEYGAYDRPVTKASPDPLRDLKRHITNAAKNEAFNSYFESDEYPMPHLNYYKDHTSDKPEKKTVIKRQYDSDMTL